jgi:shikimate dehydrogenase
MLLCGLLGRRLGHSYSPAIHAMLGDYRYELFEREPEELADFLRNGPFHGLNVTIPYKKTVAAACAALSDTARLLGSVNTVVRRPDGSLYGDNTDSCGFESLMKKRGVSAAGKKALVLGSGGASVTVCAVLRAHGASPECHLPQRGKTIIRSSPATGTAALLVNTHAPGHVSGSTAPWRGPGGLSRPLRRIRHRVQPLETALKLRAEALGVPPSAVC